MIHFAQGYGLRLAAALAACVLHAALGVQSASAQTTVRVIETLEIAGTAASAQVNSPDGIAVDASGNIYIADRNNHRIRKIDAVTGHISTVAGTGTAGFSGDGAAATAAQLNSPRGIAVDSSGNIYVGDNSNHRIRKIDAATGNISTVAGTSTGGFSGDGAAATSAQLNDPEGVALDSSGNIYIADAGNERIRKVTVADGNISTVAGTGARGTSGDGGAATAAPLNSPYDVAVDSSGNIYIVDYSIHRIRKVTVSTGIISTVAGSGSTTTGAFAGDGGAATAARLNFPYRVALDSSGNIYIADSGNDRIRKVTVATGNISTVAGGGSSLGDGGSATSAQLDFPAGVAVDSSGNIYIGDFNDHRIRKVTVASGNISTVAGTGTAGFSGDLSASAPIASPNHIALDAAGNLYVAEQGNHRIRKIEVSTGVISTVAGTSVEGNSGDGGAATAAQLDSPSGVALDSAGNIYIADTDNHSIRKVTVASGNIAVLAGTGSSGFSGDGGAATSAQLSSPSAVALDSSGNVYIADGTNERIRKVTIASGIIETIAGTGLPGYSGDGGLATGAQVNFPLGVALDSAGNVYISDTFGQRIRKIDAADSTISTVAGTGAAGFSGDGGLATAAQLNYPRGLTLDSAGNLYIGDYSNHRVRKVDADTGNIETIAGSGTAGFSGDGRAAILAQLNRPFGVAVDSAGEIYIADLNNNRIRRTRTVPRPPDEPSEPGQAAPPNLPPVAVGAFEDLDLDPGGRMEVSLLRKFRDPEGGALAYSAESLNPEVATAAVSNGRLWVNGRSGGLATVQVKATDSGGLSAQQAFQVTVGRVLTFAAASAAAPEGGLARLRVELTQPAEQAVSVGYVLESDSDPATADADAEDHGGSDGTVMLAAGETEAFIEVPILDDDNVEPAREFLQVRLLAPAAEADWALGLAAASVVIQEGVCDRTPEVRDALRGSRECWAPSVAELAGTGYLNLGRQRIGSLRERDLLGLPGLRVLHLHGNRLAELPGGLFAGLDSLERLRLEGNRLSVLPDGLFEGLGRLSSLDLGGNRLSSLSAGLLADAPSLSRLDLGGNWLSELPTGFFEGASNLAELNLSGNPGAPFTLTMALTRTDAEDHAPGPATVAARVAEGAPFALSAGLAAEGAELSTDMAAVGAGEVSGAPIQVALTEGGAARLSLSGAPEAPSALCGEVDEGRYPCFQGLVVEAGPSLLLFKRPPWVVRAVPEQGVESLGGPLSLNLAGLFAADRDDALSYAAESSDPALAAVNVSGGILSIEPNGEGLEGFVTVTLRVTDSDGLETEHSFTVEVSPQSRRFGSGWRLGLLMGTPSPSAEAAPHPAEPQ